VQPIISRFSLPTMSDSKAPRLTSLRNPTNVSTPIPPSLQAKMAAIANRGGPAPTSHNFNSSTPVDAAAAMLHRAHLDSHPVLLPAHSFPRGAKPSSMAARRQKPAFKLRDIDANLIPDSGPAAFGLAPGRPSALPEARRPQANNFASPFSNFSKIVYVPRLVISSHPSPDHQRSVRGPQL